jgi:2-oxo-4-hydroxy-4-carboxy-5-ureidoimidazoline decarboxylase
MNIKRFNKLSRQVTFSELERCCGSTAWVKGMLNAGPFLDKDSLHKKSDEIWSTVSKADILEAFKHHPQIGDVDSLKKKFASTATWAGNEQKGTSQASDQILLALQKGNQDYLDKFGFIFIVCATGKSAQEMLDLLNERLPNDEAIELHIAAAEQNKITHLRLNKLLED